MQDLILERTAKTPQVEFMALERKLTLLEGAFLKTPFSSTAHSWIGCKPFVRGRWANRNPRETRVLQHEFFQVPDGHAQAREASKCDAEVHWYYEEEDEDMEEGPAKTTPRSSSCPSSLWRLQETTDSGCISSPAQTRAAIPKSEHIEHQRGNHVAPTVL